MTNFYMKDISKPVYIVKDKYKNFNFKVYQANIVGIFTKKKSVIGYMIRLEDSKEIEEYPDFEVYEKLSEAQEEAERLNQNSFLFRLIFCH